METSNKMQWLIDEYLKGSIKYEINETNRKHGAISKPTGSGKSSLFINDIIYRIVHRDAARKLIINVSTPIIKLCEQQGNDIMHTLEGVANHLGINNNEIVLFMNNSGDVNNYTFSEYTMHTFNSSSIKNKFLNVDDKNVAIIISCHPSLADKMIPWIKNNDLDGIDIVTYIDEAHTVSSKIVNTDEDDTHIDLVSLCNKSDVYLISATNKQELVKIVNAADGIDDDSFIIMETPAEAITANKICYPSVSIKQTVEGEIDINICIDFMNSIIKDGNIHKVLISCKDTEHLLKLKKQLNDNGYKVFSTCSREGMIGLENTEFEYSNNKFNDVVSFIKSIDDCTENCFILHIRQLISGIDVSSISDCIIQKNDTDNYNSYSNIIQTIGRSLRLGKERGKSTEDRLKKHSNVLFVTNEDNENVYTDIDRFMFEYYGRGKYEFHIPTAGTKHSKNNEDKIEIGWENLNNIFDSGEVVNYWDNITMNIKKYIEEKVIPFVETAKIMGFNINSIVNDEIKKIENKYNENLSNVYLLKYIHNDNMRLDVEKIFNTIISL